MDYPELSVLYDMCQAGDTESLPLELLKVSISQDGYDDLLYHSCWHGQLDVVKYLLRATPANIYMSDCICLSIACEHESLDVARFIIENFDMQNPKAYEILSSCTTATAAQILEQLTSQREKAILDQSITSKSPAATFKI